MDNLISPVTTEEKIALYNYAVQQFYGDGIRTQEHYETLDFLRYMFETGIVDSEDE